MTRTGRRLACSVPAIAVFVAAAVGQLQAGAELSEVRFQGNRAFSRRLLAGVVSAEPRKPVSETGLERDARVLEEFYRDRGFFEVQVEKGLADVRGRWVATFYVSEGERSKINRLIVSGNRDFAEAQLLRLLPVREGDFFSRAAVEAGEAVLKSFYLNSGYAFVVVSSNIVRDQSAVTVTYDIHEGPFCRIAEVRVRGNLNVRADMILRAAEIRPGETFSHARLQEAQRRLYATRLFARVLFYVLKPESVAVSGPSPQSLIRQPAVGGAQPVVVRFDVVEQAYRGVVFGAGFEYPPARVLGSVGWSHDNLFGRCQTLQVGAEFSPDFVGGYRFGADATWRVPYLVLTRVDFQTHPFFYWERRESTTQREYGIESGMSRALSSRLRFGLFNRLRLVADTAAGITNSVILSGQYDSRDEIFDPHRGAFCQTAAEVAGGPLLGDNDLYRLTAEARWFQSLGGDFVLALRAMGGRLIPYGRTKKAPYYEQFSLGGRNYLRGYPDRSLGPDTVPGSAAGRYGPAIVNANVEVRGPYVLGWVAPVGFLDCGQITSGAVDLLLRKLEFGAGAGVRVRTPIGPIRLDWGKRLKSPPPGDWGRLYFGILHAF
ncbi:MAG: BamA/TamA family outer membrane protein [candidate division WOR-3 bacterium]